MEESAEESLFTGPRGAEVIVSPSVLFMDPYTCKNGHLPYALSLGMGAENGEGGGAQ